MSIQLLRGKIWDVSNKLLFWVSFLAIAIAAASATESVVVSREPLIDSTIQLGHDSSVEYIRIIGQGKRIASLDGQGNVKVWDEASKVLLRSISVGKSSVTFAIADQSDVAAIAAGEDEVHLLDLASGKISLKLKTRREAVTALFFSPLHPYLVVGHEDGVVTVWDITEAILVNSWKAAGKAIVAISISEDDRYLLTTDLQQTIKCWNGISDRLRWESHEHAVRIRSIAISSDGKLAASAGGRLFAKNPGDNAIRIWDLDTGATLHRLINGSGVVVGATFFDVSNRFAAVDSSGDIKVWDANTGSKISSANGLQMGIGKARSIAAHSNGMLVLGGNAKIAAYDPRTGHIVDEFRGVAARFLDMSIARDGATVLAGVDADVVIWSLLKGTFERLPASQGARGGHTSVALSRDSRFAAARWDNSAIDVWDRLTNQIYWHIENSRDGEISRPPDRLKFSEDGNLLLLAGDDESVRLYDVRRKTLLQRYYGQVGTIFDASFGDDGSIWSVGGDGLLIKWNLETGKIEQKVQLACENVTAASFVSDSSIVLISEGEDEAARLRSFDTSTGSIRKVFEGYPGWTQFITVSPDATLAASGSGSDALLRIWDLQNGKLVRSFSGHSDLVEAAGFGILNNIVVSIGGGASKVWDLRTSEEIATLIFERDRDFLAAKNAGPAEDWAMFVPGGRFDAGRLDPIRTFEWVASDDPFRSLVPEIFMRDYFEPRLLPRLLACRDAEAKGAVLGCKNAFKPVRRLAELNRIQPDVKFGDIRRLQTGEVLVRVEATAREDMSQKNGKTRTDAYDLRLFRDGALVGQLPEAAEGSDEITAWRQRTHLKPKEGTKVVSQDFVIKLPTTRKQESVLFTAYAFNEDRVKSATATLRYPLASEMAARDAKAYVVAIGANSYEAEKRELQFAVRDAEVMRESLSKLDDYKVVPISLPSDGRDPTGWHATKANIRAVLSKLAGKPTSPGLLAGVSGADQLSQATPDDVVIITFSGHGYTAENGTFYLLPSDSGQDLDLAGQPETLAKFISSEELSEWLRPIDAGQMAMIIDACHSAASVDRPGFKPGPMGDRGLGQLAYDKAMRILAASQADDVALESMNLKQGLLTYALVHEGLAFGPRGQRAADANLDGKLTLAEWLRYGEQRTPALFEDIRAGRKDAAYVGRDPVVVPDFRRKVADHAQTPSLFDFARQDSVVLQP
jgi:WD40 repeat protein